LGSNSCVFSDEIIAQLIPKKRFGKITLPYGCELNLFDEIDPNEKYYLGVDTAMSAGSGSDYSAIVLARASDGKPSRHRHRRFAVVKRFAQVVKALIKSLKILADIVKPVKAITLVAKLFKSLFVTNPSVTI
jgi:hypothetical protein